ncbi:MAG: hypothetical protein WBE76_23675 [Terracidiphilus sp.]
MSLLNQSDVKNHLSSRFRTKIHLQPPVSRPDATGLSAAEPGAKNTNPSEFVKDYSMDHAIPGKPVTPTVNATGSIDPLASAASKSAQK